MSSADFCSGVRSGSCSIASDTVLTARPSSGRMPATDVQRLHADPQSVRDLLQDVGGGLAQPALDLRQVRIGDVSEFGQFPDRDLGPLTLGADERADVERVDRATRPPSPDSSPAGTSAAQQAVDGGFALAVPADELGAERVEPLVALAAVVGDLTLEGGQLLVEVLELARQRVPRAG